MNLIERLRTVKWEVTNDGDRMPDDPTHKCAVREIERLLEERDALVRENKALKRCAIKYLEWLGVTHMPLDQALHDDMHNPSMCGGDALEAASSHKSRN